MLEIGSLVDGKYKIVNKIGQGGMSIVYLAMNEKANKPWAVKEVRKEGVQDYEVVEQGLVKEIEILKQLNHPHLPSIIDVIDTEDSFIIIMDYIEGNSLNVALAEYGAQPQENVIEWAKQLCDVLSYIHSKDIIYRDMKPANIMLKPDGNVTLIDFGTARTYKENNLADTTCLGTVGYAAPEQFKGSGMGQTTERTDIYCLGATLYHLVTGMNPCEPPYEIKPIRQINPALSAGLERIILKCTRQDPNERYQSVAELMYALEHYQEIDDDYRKKQKRKLNAFLTTCIMTVIFAVVSIWGYISAENKKGSNYDYIFEKASDYEDFYEAIVTDPTRTEAYLGTEDFQGLIQYLINDGELNAEENAVLVKLKGGLDKVDKNGFATMVDVLEQIKKANPIAYEQICYEIGEAYLFYYNIGVEKDKYATAATWFQHAQESYPVAKMYCDISNCLQNIAKYVTAEQYAKLYEEYANLWTEVNTLQTNAENFDDDLKLRVWNEIVNMIRNNATEFCEVASQMEVINLLESIENRSSGVTNTFLKNNIADLKTNIDTTKTKISSIKNANE